MADNTIDTLELEIESNANDAERALNNLANTLTNIKKQLNGLNFKNMRSFAKDADKISKSFSGLLKTYDAVNKKMGSVQGFKIPIKADLDDFDSVIEALQERFKHVGKDFVFTGNDTELQKMISLLSKNLDKLYAKQDEMQDLGDFGGKSFIRLQRNIALVTNKMDILRQKIEENKKAAEEMAKNIKITRFDADVSESAFEPQKEKKISSASVNYNPSAMAAVFGEQAAQIQNFGDAVNKFGKLAGITLNNLKTGVENVGESAKTTKEKILQAAEGVKSGIQNAGLDIDKFEQSVENIQISNADTSGLDRLQSELNETVDKAETLGSKLRNALSGGIDLDGVGFGSLSKAIDSISGKADSLKGSLQKAFKLPDFSGWNKFSAISGLIGKAFSKIKKGAGTAAGSVKKLGNTFSSLHSVLKRISGTVGVLFKNMTNLASKAAGMVTGSLKGITGAFSKMSSIGSRGKEKSSGILGGLAKAAAGLFAVKGLADFGKSAIELGSSVTQTENVVNTAFGKMADSAYKFAETATAKFGLSELAAKQYSGTMMAMLKSSGVAQGQAAKMSTTLAGLAGDFASFYGMETDDAFSKLQSAIAGEGDALRSLGINMNVATLESYAMSRGITKAYKDMTLAEQSLLRYNYILSQTAGIQGSAARSMNTWAGQVMLLKSNLQSISAIIGQGLIAALLPAIKLLNKFMEKLTKAAKVFRDFMYVLTGKKLEGSTKGVVNDFAGMDSDVDMSAISNDSADVKDNMEDAADGMDDATSSAKKLKKALSVLPIDELNQLAGAMEDVSTSKGTSGANLADAALGLDDEGLGNMGSLFDDLYEKTDVTPINKWAKAIREAFLNHDWEGVGKTIALMLNSGLEKIYTGIKKITPKVVQAMKNLAQGVNGLSKYFNWELLGRTVGAGIALLIKSFNALFDVEKGIDFAGIGKGLAKALRGMIAEIPWLELGNAIGNGAMILIDLFSGFIEQMLVIGKNGLNGFQELGISLAEAIEGIFQKIDLGVLGTAVANLFNGLTDTIASFNKTMKDNKTWQDIADNITAGLTNAIMGIKPVEAAQALGTLVTDFLDTMLQVAEQTPWHTLGEKIGDFLINIPWGQIIGDVINIVWTVFSELISGLGGKILDKMPEIGTALAHGFGWAVNHLDDFIQKFPWSGLGQTVADSLNNLVSGIDWEKLGNLISDFFKGALDFINAAIEGTDWQAIGDSIGDFLAGIDWGGVVGRLAEGIGAVMGALAGLLWGLIKDAWQSVIDWWEEKAFDDGKFTIAGLLNGILEGIANIAAWIWEHIAKPFLSGFKKAFGIHSPSTVMKELGNFIIAGLYGGLTEKIGGVLKWFSELPGTLKEKLGDLKTKFKGKGMEIISGLKSGLDGKWKDFKSALSGLGEKIEKAFPNLKSIGKKAIQGLMDGIKSVKLTLPHIDVSWVEHGFGDAKFKLPSFGLKWYASGGLAYGPTIAGIGEAGKEAVLPLENPRTMRMIADSIMADAPAAGIDEEALTNAVAKGVAMAMMNNAPVTQNRADYIQNSIYLDGSVLARVVTKAQQELDYRMNATPQFG